MALTRASIDRLKSQLLTSGLSQKDQPLFQIINTLINAVSESLSGIQTLSGGSGSGGSVLGQSFLTRNNDQVTLANSRQVIPGGGIAFNDDGQKIVISSSIPPGFGLDGEDGEQGIPGIQGPQGVNGIAGLSGLTIGPPFYEHEEIDYPFPSIQLNKLPPNDPGADIPYSAGNFTATGGATWGVVLASNITYAYFYPRVGFVTVFFQFDSTQITVATPQFLQVAMPFTPSRNCRNMMHYYQAGYNVGLVRVQASSALLQFAKTDLTNWAIDANTSIEGQITFPI